MWLTSGSMASGIVGPTAGATSSMTGVSRVARKQSRKQGDWRGGLMLLPRYECLRCGYRWIPRIETLPKRCARCRTPYWNRPVVRQGVSQVAKATRGKEKEDKAQAGDHPS